MLKEARVILPFSTEGFGEPHQEFRRKVMNTFGGFTVTEGLGGWDGIVERVGVYDIAIEGGQTSVLVFLALEAARALKQEAVYLRYPSGQVSIVPVTQKEIV